MAIRVEALPSRDHPGPSEEVADEALTVGVVGGPVLGVELRTGERAFLVGSELDRTRFGLGQAAQTRREVLAGGTRRGMTEDGVAPSLSCNGWSSTS